MSFFFAQSSFSVSSNEWNIWHSNSDIFADIESKCLSLYFSRCNQLREPRVLNIAMFFFGSKENIIIYQSLLLNFDVSMKSFNRFFDKLKSKFEIEGQIHCGFVVAVVGSNSLALWFQQTIKTYSIRFDEIIEIIELRLWNGTKINIFFAPIKNLFEISFKIIESFESIL